MWKDILKEDKEKTAILNALSIYMADSSENKTKRILYTIKLILREFEGAPHLSNETDIGSKKLNETAILEFLGEE